MNSSLSQVALLVVIASADGPTLGACRRAAQRTPIETVALYTCRHK